MATIKVFDPVSVPLSVLQELQELRALVEQLRRENERLRQENERLRGELDEARAGLDRRTARPNARPRRSPRGPQAAAQEPRPKAGEAHGRHGHRSAPSPAVVDEVLERPCRRLALIAGAGSARPESPPSIRPRSRGVP